MINYVLNSDGKSYIAVSENDKTIEKAIIPDIHEGLPVTEVKVSYEDFANLKEIVIGNNVTKTGFGTFNCPLLEKIYLGKSINSISGPFFSSVNLTDIYFSGSEDDFNNIYIVTVDESNEIFLNAHVHYGILGNSAIITHGEDKIFPYTHWNCIKGKPQTVNSEKVSYNNLTSGLKSCTVKDAIDELNARLFDASALESWDELKYLVRSGRAADFINIGDKFSCYKNGSEVVWDVIGIDVDIPEDSNFSHSITLQLSDCYINIPFSVPELSYYSLNKIKAGKYYLGLKNYASETIYYGFTIPQDLTANSGIRISEGVVYIYNNKYSPAVLTLEVESSSTSPENMTGTLLKADNYVINSNMGTVNYKHSVVRLWLNADGTNWFESSDINNMPPLDYINTPGFMNGMDQDFLDAISPVKKTTILPDGTQVETADKFFLLSVEEVYGKAGNAYPFYKNNSNMTDAGIIADAIRVKSFNGTARHWWLRDSANGDNGYMRVLTDGGIGSVKASKILAYGAAPACCIC